MTLIFTYPSSIHQPFPYIHLSTRRRRFPRKIVTFPELNRCGRRLGLSLGCARPLDASDVDGVVVGVNSVSCGYEEGVEIENGDMLLEMCVVRDLEPVIRVEDGLEKIRDELEKMKVNPPFSKRGILRFQVFNSRLIVLSFLERNVELLKPLD